MPELTTKGEAWVDDQAEHLADITDVAEDFNDKVAARYMELLNKPGERNKAIAWGIVGYLYNRSVEEFGSDELALAYWVAVDEYLDMSWAELHSIPVAKRGDIWNTARRVIDVLAMRQAQVDTGFLSTALEQAIGLAAERKREWKKIPDSERVKIAKASGLSVKSKEKTNARKKEREATS